MDFLKNIINKKPKGQYIMSLDVGTKVAKALVSYADYEEGSITNLGVGRAHQKTGNIVGGRITDVTGVIAACRKAIEDARKMAETAPQETIMGFSGNTVKICTDSFEVERQSPGSRIDANELKNIIKEVHRESLAEIQKNLTYREREIGIKLVSADIVSFSIDGYRVINPLSFRGKKIKIAISNSYVLRSDFDIINGIAQGLGLKLLKIAYGPYAVVKAIGAGDALNFSATIIDIGGNITDVVMVRNGNIHKAGMFIVGGHVFTKRLANTFGISEENAENLKLNYSKGRLNAGDQKKVEEILSEDITLWLSGVQLIMEEASRDFLVPSTILCYGGSSQLPGLAASLNRLQQHEISFSSKMKLDFIRLAHIGGNMDKTNKLNDFQDITLTGLAHLCLDFVDTEDTANAFLAQII